MSATHIIASQYLLTTGNILEVRNANIPVFNVEYNGNINFAGNLIIAQGLDVAGLLNANGGIAVDTDKFTVSSTGNVVIDGTLDVGSTLDVTGITTLSALLNADGGIAVDTGLFTVEDVTGNTYIDGTLDVNDSTIFYDTVEIYVGDFTIYSDAGVTPKFAVTASNGITTIAGLLNANGGIAVDTDKFTVADSTGNTIVAGTLDVTGIVNLNNTTESSAYTSGALIVDGGVGIAKNLNVQGNTAITGTLDTTGDLKVNTNKVVITAATGDASIAGVTSITDTTQSTSISTGALKISGGLAITKDTYTSGRFFSSVDGFNNYSIANGTLNAYRQCNTIMINFYNIDGGGTVTIDTKYRPPVTIYGCLSGFDGGDLLSGYFSITTAGVVTITADTASSGGKLVGGTCYMTEQTS
jgi:hypothetical protein